MTVLEIGPGGGKWTVRLAPKVKKLIVLDVAEEMLTRTRKRCESLGIKNVEYVLSNGKDFQKIADESISFYFSYDVFLHIALEDTFPYTQEIFRVLVPGAIGICHYAINSVPEAWDRITQNNDWYRNGKHTLGQFYYFSPESLRRMFEHCGLQVKEQHQEGYYCTNVFEKPTKSERSHSWNKELQAGKNWLESELQAWMQTARQNQAELEPSKNAVTAMQSSKFWKLRTVWLRIKTKIGLTRNK